MVWVWLLHAFLSRGSNLLSLWFRVLCGHGANSRSWSQMSDAGWILWHELLSWYLLIHRLPLERMEQTFSHRVSSLFVPALGLELLLGLDSRQSWIWANAGIMLSSHLRIRRERFSEPVRFNANSGRRTLWVLISSWYLRDQRGVLSSSH